MRASHQVIADAFAEHRSKTIKREMLDGGKTEISADREGGAVYLHGSPVIRWCAGWGNGPRHWANMDPALGPNIAVTLAGWGTATTRSWINDVLQAVGINGGYFQQKGEQFLVRTGDNEPIPAVTDAWYDMGPAHPARPGAGRARTTVLFRRDRESGQILAIFPYEPVPGGEPDECAVWTTLVGGTDPGYGWSDPGPIMRTSDPVMPIQVSARSFKDGWSWHSAVPFGVTWDGGRPYRPESDFGYPSEAEALAAGHARVGRANAKAAKLALMLLGPHPDGHPSGYSRLRCVRGMPRDAAEVRAFRLANDGVWGVR